MSPVIFKLPFQKHCTSAEKQVQIETERDTMNLKTHSWTGSCTGNWSMKWGRVFELASKHKETGFSAGRDGGFYHKENLHLCKAMLLCWCFLLSLCLWFVYQSAGGGEGKSPLLCPVSLSSAGGLWGQKFLSLNSASPFSSLHFIFIICKDEINN